MAKLSIPTCSPLNIIPFKFSSMNRDMFYFSVVHQKSALILRPYLFHLVDFSKNGMSPKKISKNRTRQKINGTHVTTNYMYKST